MVTDRAELVSVAGAPLLGAGLLGVQLWMYGVLHVPWNPVTLIGPWLLTWGVTRRRLIEAIKADWETVRVELEGWRHTDRFALILGVLTAVLALTYLLNLVTQPLIGFDAISMWFFKAKYFFTTQTVDPGTIPGLSTTWPGGSGPFRATAGFIRNLVYPPLYSLMVASMYAMTGGVHDTLGKGVDFVFVLVGAAVVWAALVPVAGRARAAIFSFLITGVAAVQAGLGNPIYTGYADYPIGIAMVASLANLYRAVVGGGRATWIFAILFAAIAALMKSEGLPFLLAVLLVAAFKQRRVVVEPPVVVGIALVLGWQVFAAAHGWRSTHLLSDRLSNLPLLVPGRAALIIAYVVRAIALRVDYFWLAAALLTSIWLVLRQPRTGERWVLFVVGFQLLTYFSVWVLNPGELTGSIDRLVIQVVPAAVLLLGLATAPDEQPDLLPLPPRVELVGE
jgi:hypothetical protein